VIKQLLDAIIFKGNNHTTARLVQEQQEIPLFAVLLVAVAVSVGNVLLSRNTDIYFVG
jgi:hypothetical protein